MSYPSISLYSSKKTISICLHQCFCLPWRSICRVFSTLNGKNEKNTPIFPNAPEALDNPQASTIRGNWPKISPIWASKVCSSARCVGYLVAWLVASPIFCGKGKMKGNMEKIVLFLFTPLKKKIDGILCWKTNGSLMAAEVMEFLVWGGALRKRREKGEVWSLEIGKPFPNAGKSLSLSRESWICLNYIHFYNLKNTKWSFPSNGTMLLQDFKDQPQGPLGGSSTCHLQ